MHAPTMHCKLGSIYINQDIPLAPRKDAPQVSAKQTRPGLDTNELASWRCLFSLTCLGHI